MAPPDEPTKPRPLRVELDAVALWEPVPHAQKEKEKAAKGAKKAAGLSIQSWDFKPPSSGAGATFAIEIVEPAQEYRLDDGTLTVIGNAKSWSVEAKYVETREFPASDGSPRPKHFFEAKVPKNLAERLRESPSDILGKSDLYDGELPSPPKKD